MPSKDVMDKLFGDSGGRKGVMDQLFPVDTPTTTAPVEPISPKLNMFEQLRKSAEEKPSVFGFRPTNTLSMSLEEYDKLEMNPVVGDEFKQDFMDIMSTYGSLIGKPEEFVRGFSNLMVTIPGFMLGVVNAGRKVLEATNVPDSTLLDFYNAASEGMGEVMEFWGPQITEKVTGKPTKESELTVGTMIAPIPFLHALGEKVAFGTEFPQIAASVADELSAWTPHPSIMNDVLRYFSDEENVQGAVMFMSDVLGLASMHKAWKGPKGEAAAELGKITNKAVKLTEKRQAAEGITDEAIKRVQIKQLEIEKARLEKEAADLKAKIDADQATVENLRGKGKKVKRIKAYRTAEQRQAQIEKTFKEGEKVKTRKPKKPKTVKEKIVEQVVAEELIVEERTEPLVDRSNGLPKHPTDPEAIAAASEHNLIYHGWADKSEYGKQGGYWYTDATTKSSFRVEQLEDLPRKIAEMRGEPEPISEVDTLTGMRQPEQLDTHNSPFRETPERTLQLREQFTERKYEDNVELMTQKLLNDVNRYLDGEDVDITHTRELLSTLATRSEELWREFSDPGAFTNWKDLIGEAAEWARRADRTEGVELRSKIGRRAKEAGMETPLEEDLALIKALEDQYKKPIEQITDAEVEQFFVEGEGAGKKVDWFGEDRLNMMIPLDEIMRLAKRFGIRLRTVKKKDLSKNKYYHSPDLRKEMEADPKTSIYSGQVFVERGSDAVNWVLNNRLIEEIVLPEDPKTKMIPEGVPRSEWSTIANEAWDAGYDMVVRGDWRVVNPNLERRFIGVGDRTGKAGATKLYAGIPLDEAAKQIVSGARAFKRYTERAVGLRKFRPKQAIKAIRSEFNRAFIDRSGNIRQSLLDDLGDEGYRVLQKMYLSKGASSISSNMLKQMQREVYGGLSKSEKAILDRIILADRMVDIGKYKKKGEFKFPEDITPERSVAYSELFPQLEGLDAMTAKDLRRRAASYYEWMRRPLKDMLDSGLISQEEFDALSTHNYRRLKIVDVYDQRYTTKIGGKHRTVYDSGVQALARGRETDVFEPSSEIMALEVFNRAYGRIMNNEANKELLSLARHDKENPFVRVKEQKSDRIPSGWQRIFVYEEGQRKALYLSPDMAREWITNSPEMSYRLSQLIRVLSGSALLRPMATGINWGFALANLPRDIMHAWYTARVFENGKWRMVYNPNLPVFLTQMGLDQARVFSDAVRRKGRYTDYINEGGGMEFLVHQGRLLSRGRRLGTPFSKIQDYLGYFGETSEIMTRLAIRERVIRRRAREQGISYEDAVKSPDITREATFAARDYMDFGQGGGVAKAMDNGLPYLNAAIQGTRGLFRAFKENPVSSGWKTAQLGSVVVGTYLASKYNTPNAWRDLKGSVDMQNNLCIPLPESLAFEDELGQMRYPYIKIPLDPGQKFFKTFFEASTDKMIGEPVDTNTVVDSLKQFSPVGVTEMPPSISAGVGYVTNKDFWLNEDIWRRTDKPFSWPRSKEEYTSKTPQAMVDIGAATGLSPERMQYALEELFTSGTLWSYMLGKGYDELFSELPESNKEQHLAEVLSKVPVIKRFIGITHPYSKHAEYVGEAQEKADLEYFVQSRGLDTLAEGHLFHDNTTEREIYKYINSFKDPSVIERLSDRYQFQKSTKDLPERSFWLRLRGLKVPARAEAYLERMDRATIDGRRQLRKELPFVAAAGGVLSDEFWAEVQKLGRSK